jgi:hypothetical protein
MTSIDPEQERAELQLTLGVEFEFILLQDTLQDDTSETDAGLYSVIQALSTPLRAICATCGKEHAFKLPLDPEVAGLSEFSKWQIADDASLTAQKLKTQFPEHFTHIVVHPCEVRSRILRAQGNLVTTTDVDVPEHTHEVTYQEEIRAVLERITDYFSPANAPRGWCMLVDETCGLHVHIGNGENADACFPLHTAKNVLALWLAHEKSIDAMQYVDRIDGSTLAHDPDRGAPQPFDERTLATPPAYNKPFSAHFAYLLHDLRRDPASLMRTSNFGWPRDSFAADPELRRCAENNDLISWISIIDKAEHVRQYEQLQTEFFHKSVIDTSNLMPFVPTGVWPSFGKKLTFEFRQHAGTVDPQEVLPWIDVLTRMLYYAHENTQQDVQARCASDWRDPACETLHFLDLLGYAKTDVVFRHYKRVLGLQAHITTATSTSYARECRARDEQIARGYASANTVFAELLQWEAEAMQLSRDCDAVRERIEGKFLAGCYGQFEAGFLDELPAPQDALTAEEKTKLTLGWRPDVVLYDPLADSIAGTADALSADRIDGDGDAAAAAAAAVASAFKPEIPKINPLFSDPGADNDDDSDEYMD